VKKSKNIRSILSSGFYLDVIKTSNWVLNKKQALEAFAKLDKLGAVILGVDIVEFTDGMPSYNYRGGIV